MLDPTCGSGAFLFAALNVLLPLYEACLQRMKRFVDDADRADPERNAGKHPDFRRILALMAEHPSPRYFVLKSIILENLYGVDIMEEAVEICKLRLFLKLVAQVEPDASRPGYGIEPLPDIDFNIRAGNALVGFARYEDVEQALTYQMDFEDALTGIRDRAEDADRLFKQFRLQQTTLGGAVTAADKAALRDGVADLALDLDRHHARQYGVEPARTADFDRWRKTHQPFHWFVEFYGIMASGGFNVIIGNPPYVEYRGIKNQYTVLGFETLICGDLYAYITERAYILIRTKGRLGLIVPISVFATDGFASLQALSSEVLDMVWVSCFANRPSQLFDGAQKRLTILIGRSSRITEPIIHTTTYLRWSREERPFLFSSRIRYARRPLSFIVFPSSLEKLGSDLELMTLSKIMSSSQALEMSIARATNYHVYYTRKFSYFLAFTDFVPSVTELKTGHVIRPSELKALGFESNASVKAIIAALSSSTFFWFWNTLSDCRNLNRRDILSFPLNVADIPEDMKKDLARLGNEYLEGIVRTSRAMLKGGLEIQTFNYAVVKAVLDKVDRVLATHYGLTDEELDFIINYDFKYRMGAGADAGDV